MNRLDKIGLAVFCLLFIGFIGFCSWALVVYGIQGKPTRRERDRQHISQLQQQVQQLDLRVKLLEAK